MALKVAPNYESFPGARPFLCCHLCFRSVLLSSRRLWPAPMTAPLAAFPPMAPTAAPFAAPLALGWELLGLCVAAGGVCVDGVCVDGVCAGGVCANAAGTTAPDSAIIRDITLAECFIKASWPSVPIRHSVRVRRLSAIGDRLYCPVVGFFLGCEVGLPDTDMRVPLAHVGPNGANCSLMRTIASARKRVEQISK